MKIDIISDLNIDHWDKSYKSKYPRHKSKHLPYSLDNTAHQEDEYILIIAGNISSDFNMSIEYLKEQLRSNTKYSKILFIDGNYEHCNEYPELKCIFEMAKKTKEANIFLQSDKLIFLHDDMYIINDTAFVGVNGWWDYNKIDPEVIRPNVKNYFKNWRPDMTFLQIVKFIDKVAERSILDAEYVHHCMSELNEMKNIKKIVIISHSVPLREFASEDVLYTTLNTYFEDLVTSDLFDNGKQNHWIFGHTHKSNNKKINNIQFISNPRSSDDFGQENYKHISMTI